LAAKIWDVPLSVAVGRLSDATSISVTSDDINRYIKREVIPREKATNLWRRAQRNLFKPAQKLGKLRAKLGLRTNQLSVERIEAGPSKLFGVSHVEEIKKIWEPDRVNRRKTNAFKGRRWEDVLVVPYFKAPGDVSSLLFIGRQGRPAQDYVFQTYSRRNAQHSSVGFAGLHSVIDYDGANVICMSDALAMLRIQVRNFNTSMQPLPIIAWRPDAKHRLSHNWHLFNGKRLVFWEWKPSAAVLHQCMISGGTLTLNVGPSNHDYRSISHWIRDFKTMHDVERSVLREAKDWKDALHDWSKFSHVTDGQISELLADAAIIDNRLFEEVCKALKISGRSRHYTYTTVVGHNSYTERAGVWYLDSKDKPILPGHVEVHTIITRPKNLPEYVGEVVLSDERLPFRISGKSQSVLNRALWDIVELNGYFCEKKLPLNTPGLMQIALSFRTPEVVKGKEYLGWDGAGFQFKNFRVHQGTSELTPYLLPTDTGGPQGNQYRWRPEVVRNLREAKGHEATWAWSVIFSFGAQIVASMSGRAIPWVVFDHPVHCDTAFIEILDKLDVLLTNKFWEHHWPVVSINSPNRRQKFRATIVKAGEEPRTSRGFYRVTAPKVEADFSPKNVPSAFRTVLPDFMKWLTVNVDENTFSDDVHWQLQVLTLFKRWAADRKIKSLFPVFKRAAKCLKCLPSP
jgi:hypothetical protein|tara:strand:- start:4290 stop:6341 length:2052 start_codon:yes stop_codon:yes gene_type:complete